jgi:hypothetical protein
MPFAGKLHPLLIGHKPLVKKCSSLRGEEAGISVESYWGISVAALKLPPDVGVPALSLDFWGFGEPLRFTKEAIGHSLWTKANLCRVIWRILMSQLN